jgi:hypothetical protein
MYAGLRTCIPFYPRVFPSASPHARLSRAMLAPKPVWGVPLRLLRMGHTVVRRQNSRGHGFPGSCLLAPINPIGKFIAASALLRDFMCQRGFSVFFDPLRRQAGSIRPKSLRGTHRRPTDGYAE